MYDVYLYHKVPSSVSQKYNKAVVNSKALAEFGGGFRGVATPSPPFGRKILPKRSFLPF